MKYRTIITVFLLGLGFRAGAQIQHEGLVVLTDRGHYISGEDLQYRAYYRAPVAGIPEQWSRVLYVELILPDGSPLAQAKVMIDSSGASGSLAIPEGISSGTYYLKAYTRWMRNCGPEGFAYTSLRIYDPFNEEALPVDTLGWEPEPVAKLLKQLETHSADMLECRLDREIYGTRTEVVADLKWIFPDAPADLTVSVARAGIHGNPAYYRPGCPVNLGGSSEILPEIQGLSLTGQAVSASDRSPVPYATIFVSVLGDERDFYCNYSDSAGRFYFSFPAYVGERELFVSAYQSDYEEIELLIDRDFSPDVLQLPSYAMQKSDSLASLINEMSVNAQIAQQYYPRILQAPPEPEAEELLFYGNPSSIIHIDNFIKLPNLAEYFVEVVPQVSLRRNRGGRRLVLLGNHPDLAIYLPLLLVDGVAIFDVEAVLAVSPRLIDRLEIVNAPYIRGNVTFGGIISLISKNNDLGYIDLPSSGLLVNYRMLNLPVADSTRNGVLDPRLPDIRNILYWEPALHLEPDISQKISFRTSDQIGDYEILIRGTDPTGKYLVKRVHFRVE
ncbi:MAG: hypothetical protein P1P86_14470 [Bacteroidales bacterium]|nr:hypothetical protein [Bacteroidales bacterium]